MEIKHLTFFKLTAELEHMTKAAEQLGVAQPFLSKIISELEHELEVELFDHVGRQIRLNDYGRALYKRTRQLFMELEDAHRELTDMANARDRSITLVTNTSLYMGTLLGKLRNQVPNINFHQTSAQRSEIIQRLKDGKADFAICTPAIVSDQDLETTTLIEDVCPVIYPENHWLKWRTGINLKDVQDEVFVSATKGFGIRDLADSFFATAGISPKIIVESSDTSVLPTFVKHGVGLGFCPLTTVLRDPYLRENHIVVSEPPCIGVVGLSWNKNRYQSNAAKTFRHFAQEHFASLETDD